MMTESDVLSLMLSRKPGHSLPQAFYTDPDLYQADLRNVFVSQWLFAAAAAEIPKSGNFITLQLDDYGVVIVRGADKTIRAFHNSCRHRGSRICAAAKGSAPKLVCPYHQWTYELDGRLLYARDMGADFDLAAHGLKPVHVAEAAGLVFICLADVAPDFAPLAAEAARYLGPHELGTAKVAHQSTIIEKANWKLVMENNRECYHCSGSHPSLCRTFPDNPDLFGGGDGAAASEGAAHIARCEAAGLPSAYRIDPTETWRFVRIPFLGKAVSYTMDGTSAVARGIGHVPVPDAGSCLFFSYPNTWCHFLADHALVFRILPVSPQETQVTTTWLVHPEAEEGKDYDLDRLTEVWTHTNDEDRRIVEENQVGINSPAYVPGPYSQRQEGGVIQFIDWYARTMENRLLGRYRVAAE